jgi:hypothetical protein
MKTGEDDIKRAALLENLGESPQPGAIMVMDTAASYSRILLRSPAHRLRTFQLHLNCKRQGY